MVRERAVRLEVAADGFDRKPLEHRRQHRAGHPVCCVDHDLERLDGLDVDEGENPVDVRGPDVELSHLAGVGFVPVAGVDQVAQIEEAAVAADRQGAAADELQPGVLLRVVRRGDHDPALEPERADGEIDHLGADETEVEHLRAGGSGTTHHGLLHRR